MKFKLVCKNYTRTFKDRTDEIYVGVCPVVNLFGIGSGDNVRHGDELPKPFKKHLDIAKEAIAHPAAYVKKHSGCLVTCSTVVPHKDGLLLYKSSITEGNSTTSALRYLYEHADEEQKKVIRTIKVSFKVEANTNKETRREYARAHADNRPQKAESKYDHAGLYDFLYTQVGNIKGLQIKKCETDQRDPNALIVLTPHDIIRLCLIAAPERIIEPPRMRNRGPFLSSGAHLWPNLHDYAGRTARTDKAAIRKKRSQKQIAFITAHCGEVVKEFMYIITMRKFETVLKRIDSHLGQSKRKTAKLHSPASIRDLGAIVLSTLNQHYAPHGSGWKKQGNPPYEILVEYLPKILRVFTHNLNDAARGRARRTPTSDYDDAYFMIYREYTKRAEK